MSFARWMVPLSLHMRRRSESVDGFVCCPRTVRLAQTMSCYVCSLGGWYRATRTISSACTACAAYLLAWAKSADPETAKIPMGLGGAEALPTV
jgi:hypothetical protein